VDARFGEGTYRSLIQQEDPLLLMHTVLRIGGLPSSRPSGISEAARNDILMFAANVEMVYGSWRPQQRQNAGGDG
jgi:hypothetical protein